MTLCSPSGGYLTRLLDHIHVQIAITARALVIARRRLCACHGASELPEEWRRSLKVLQKGYLLRSPPPAFQGAPRFRLRGKYLSICIYIYIYVLCIYIYIYIYIYVYVCVYIYIYIYRLPPAGCPHTFSDSSVASVPRLPSRFYSLALESCRSRPGSGNCDLAVLPHVCPLF